MILIAFYSLLLLIVTSNEYSNSQRFWEWIDGLDGDGKQCRPEAKTKPFKAQFGRFYS